MYNESTEHGDTYAPRMRRGADVGGRAGFDGTYAVTCTAPDGTVKWTAPIHNLITNAGLDHALDVTLSGGTQVTTWYVGLTDGTPTVAAADTSSSHAGWTEVTAYSESVRQTWTDGGVSSQSVTNSGSVASFSINANATTIGGAFLISVSTKGGTTGTLYSAGAFTVGDKTADSGDTLEVTATFTAADA